jgi:RTX calcium-binding nonapeptide repeat (4 copies)
MNQEKQKLAADRLQESLFGQRTGHSQGNLVADASGTLVTDNTIYGSAGKDSINGLTGNDLLMGGAGQDTIDGGEGNDMIGGGAGADAIQGGAGDDWISSSSDIVSGRTKERYVVEAELTQCRHTYSAKRNYKNNSCLRMYLKGYGYKRCEKYGLRRSTQVCVGLAGKSI